MFEWNIMNVLPYDPQPCTTYFLVNLSHVLFVTAQMRNSVNELDELDLFKGPFHIFFIDCSPFAHFFQTEWVVNVLSNKVDDSLGPP